MHTKYKHISSFILVISLVVVVLLSSSAATTASQYAAPQISGCDVFPGDNVWNVRIDHLPVDARSASYINTIGSNAHFHMDFGSGLWDGGPIGIPFTTVPGTQTKVSVSFTWPGESDAGPYPIPPDVPIEGGPNGDGDRHVLVVDRDNCILYELYNARPQENGTWRAGSGAIYDLGSHALRPAGWTSADAAGLPILPGLVRYDEVASGHITHALRFTVPQTRNAYIWPARHFASDLTGMQYPPMGQRFRLKSDYNISGFSSQAQVIALAMKEYGIILADNGSSWYVSGAPDERWDNDALHELDVLTGSNFEAVDESLLMLDANSGQAKNIPPLPAPSPLSAAAASSTQINLTWTDNSSDETQFGIERRLSGSSTWSQIGTAAANTTSYSNTGLSCGTTYQYRVRAYRSGDGMVSNYSNIASRASQTCGVPTLSGPANNIRVSDKTPAFGWNAIAGATQYQIQLDNNSDFSSLVFNLVRSGIQYTPGDGLNDGRYYWRVRAGGAGDVWSGWSSAWRIYIDTKPPTVPRLITPADGVIVNDDTPRFEWRASSGAKNYHLQVDNNSDFSSMIIKTHTVSTSYTDAAPLRDRVYYWRVRAQDAAGNWSKWSAKHSFTVAAGSPAPSLLPIETPTVLPETPMPPTEIPATLPPTDLLTIESNDDAAARGGNWTMYDTPYASGGQYIYSSGSTDDTLTLAFTGRLLDIVYVKHPALGLFVVEVDGAAVQVVDSTAAESEFGARVSLTLTAGTHLVRIYPQSGTIAIDAFGVESLAAVPTLTEVEPTVTAPVLPTGTPVETLTETPIVIETVPPTVTPLPTQEPTNTPVPPTETVLPTETATETPTPTETPAPTTIPAELLTSTTEPPVEPTAVP